jgi:hypothetical protein
MAELLALLALTKQSLSLSLRRRSPGEGAAVGDGAAWALKPACRGSSRTTPRPGADNSGSSSGYRSDAFAQLTCVVAMKLSSNAVALAAVTLVHSCNVACEDVQLPTAAAMTVRHILDSNLIRWSSLVVCAGSGHHTTMAML